MRRVDGPCLTAQGAGPMGVDRLLGNISLLGVFTSYAQWKTDHTSVFLCKDFKFVGKSDAEIAEVKAFPLNALPETMYILHRSLLIKYREGNIKSNFGEW